MSSDIGISLTGRERSLLSKYAYPFERLANELRKQKNHSRRAVLTTEGWEWEQAVGNIAISMNEMDLGFELLEELEALASLIENEIKYR